MMKQLVEVVVTKSIVHTARKQRFGMKSIDVKRVKSKVKKNKKLIAYNMPIIHVDNEN